MGQKKSKLYKKKTKIVKKQKSKSKKSFSKEKRGLDSLDLAIQKMERLILKAQESLNTSRAIQKKMQPTEFSLTPDFEFSMKFIPGSNQGGNYHNIIEQKDPLCFGLMLAESTNYQTSAVFLSQILQLGEAIRSKERSRPLYIGKTLIKEIPPLLEDKDETHCFYAKVDRRSFEMTYVKLGNTVALLQKDSKKSLTALPSSFGPIKNQFSPLKNLKERKIFLDAKDRLILCTQSLLATENEKGENFGLKRLSQAILKSPKKNIHALRNQILFDLSQFAKNSLFSKDLTVLACEIKERVIKLAKEE